MRRDRCCDTLWLKGIHYAPKNQTARQNLRIPRYPPPHGQSQRGEIRRPSGRRGAETAAERVAAKLVLAEVPLWVLHDNPAVPYDQDEITRVIQDAVDQTIYNEIKDWTVGDFREWMLADTTTGEMIRRISNGLTAEMVAGVTKLMSNLDLMYAAKKIPVSAHCNNTIGTPGTLSSRNQPNHPTDSPEGIRAEIYEGLSYGSGDSVIGINPVDDSYGSVARLLDMTYDVIKTWNIPTQNCVLSHVTTQMKCYAIWLAGGARLPIARGFAKRQRLVRHLRRHDG